MLLNVNKATEKLDELIEQFAQQIVRMQRPNSSIDGVLAVIWLRVLAPLWHINNYVHIKQTELGSGYALLLYNPLNCVPIIYPDYAADVIMLKGRCIIDECLEFPLCGIRIACSLVEIKIQRKVCFASSTISTMFNLLWLAFTVNRENGAYHLTNPAN